MSLRSRALAAVALAATALVAASPVSAFTLMIDGGKLTGVKNIEYNSAFYDLTLVDGACADAYGSCETASFPSALIGNLGNFGSFLLSTVLVDQPGFAIDSDPTLTFGCSSETACSIGLAQSYSNSNGYIYAYYVNNYAASSASTDGVTAAYGYTPAQDLSERGNIVWGVVTASSVEAAVPLPAAAALLPMGLAGLGLVARRRRRA